MKRVIVLVTGCWDLLHFGHVRLLQNAKRLAGPNGILIVGVNSDESMFSYKGAYPVISCDHRMEVIRELRCADVVFENDNHDKSKLFQLIKPQYYVTGDDWDTKDIEGHKELEKHGGMLVQFPYTKTISTTEIIKKINDFGYTKRSQDEL